MRRKLTPLQLKLWYVLQLRVMQMNPKWFDVAASSRHFNQLPKRIFIIVLESPLSILKTRTCLLHWQQQACSGTCVYNVSQKNPCDYVFYDNLNSRRPIVIIFGTITT